MKITRALLLSSKKQAEAWEQTIIATWPWTQYRKSYRFLVTEDSGLCLQIFRLTQQKHEEKTYNVLADNPHVEKSFRDTNELTDFLRDYNIDFEDGWQPVESE